MRPSEVFLSSPSLTSLTDPPATETFGDDAVDEERIRTQARSVCQERMQDYFESEEFAMETERRFKAADVDGSGELDMAEVHALLLQFWGEFGQEFPELLEDQDPPEEDDVKDLFRC